MKNHFLRFTGSRTLAGGWLIALLLGWSQLLAQPGLVKDINPGPAGSDPMELTDFKNTLFFTANDGTHGRELWKSNGTTAGTVLVKDVAPGAWGNVSFLSATADSLFFVNRENADGGSFHEYWRSDGTGAGTVLVTEFVGFDLTAYKGDVYFIDGYEGDPPNSTRLMKVGPATGGVTTVKQLRTDYGPGYGGVYFLREHDGFLYTASGALTEECCLAYKLWKSDGTGAGTTAIDLPGNHRTSRMKAYRFEGQYFYFTISDFHLTPEFPFFHYRTDLNTGETVLLGNTRWDDETLTRTAGTGAPAAEAATAGNASVTINGYRFFSASDVLHGTELWKEPAVAQNTFRLNAGGAAYATTGGRLFAADAYFTGGRRSTAVSGAVDSTADDALYQVGRYGASFGYNLPLGNGTYDVVLHFNETYWGNVVPGWAGSRKFNVDIEGQRKLTEYDIYAKAGGDMRALRESFRVSVDDGTLNLLFSKGSADLAYVSAIEVAPASGPAVSFYRAINLNGDAITLDGYPWAGKTAGDYHTNGRGFVNTLMGLTPATDDIRASMIRSSVWHWSDLRLNLTAVPAGKYLVYLYTWEDNAPQSFSISLEGKVVQSGYNSGSAGRWARLGPYAATITDGTLSLGATGGNANFSGIEVWRITDGPAPARVAAVGTADTPTGWAVRLYPNPVQDQLTVQLPLSAGDVQSTTVTDALGRVQLYNAHQAAGKDRLLIPTGALPKGLYLLTLDTGQGSRLVKFMKQ